MKKNIESEKTKISGSLFASGGVIASIFAVIGASCCILPLVLINLGISVAVVGNLALMSAARPYFILSALGLVVLSFIAAYRHGNRPRGVMIGLLILASFFIVFASILPFFEPSIVKWISS
ncbi:mercuric transporter MerT family protein [Hyphococcus sp. DH-69]|uniref:mercuric transporter MerT family protein n=1 Tax=Hyphococcus formosus TaxID=3143534 RepID=UPI00398B13B3